MIRLTKALLTLGVGMATATTAIAQPAGGLAVTPSVIVSGSNLVRRPHCQQQMGTGICCTNTAQKYVHVRATTQHPHAQNKHERPLLEAQQKEPQARVRAWGSRSHYSRTCNLLASVAATEAAAPVVVQRAPSPNFNLPPPVVFVPSR